MFFLPENLQRSHDGTTYCYGMSALCIFVVHRLIRDGAKLSIRSGPNLLEERVDRYKRKILQNIQSVDN